MKKLILFGDSLIKNINKPLSNEIEKQTGVDVYNCAVGGWDTNDGAAKAPFIAQLEPDFVLFSFGTNDAAPWKQVDINTFEQNILKIFSVFSSAGKIYFLPPPLNETYQTGDEKRSNELQRQYAEAVEAVALSSDVKIIDSWAIFKPMLESNQDYHDEDGVHFNDFGNQTLVGEIVRAINENTIS